METQFAVQLLEDTDGFTLSAIIKGKLIQHTYYGDNIGKAKRQFLARYAN